MAELGRQADYIEEGTRVKPRGIYCLPMLDEARNKLLTRVSRGTPMGELLRRYWTPIAAVSEFENQSVKPVRLMGEDLALYKDLNGTFGLVDRQCPHRRADLTYG